MNIEDLKQDEEEAVEAVIDGEEEAPDPNEEEAVEGEENPDGEEGEEDEGEEQPVSLIEWEDDDGNVWEIPEAIKPALMKNKDYTVKTQSLAEERKALDAEREAWKASQQRDEEDFKIAGELFNIDQQLARYQNVDWVQLEQTDPDSANSHFRQMQFLKDRKQELAQTQKEREAQRSGEAQQAVAKRHQETEQWISENIPNWDSNLARELQEYATKTVGYDLNQLQQTMSPQLMRMLYDGYTGQKVKQKAASKPKAKTNVQPLRKVSAKSGTTTRIDLAKADMDTYAKARMRGVGG